MRRLASELGIDVQACVETAYDLARHVAESEASARYAEVAGQRPGVREKRLLYENKKLRRDAERLAMVNRHLWMLMMEEGHFIEAGWLRRCIQAACVADDQDLVTRLGKMQDKLNCGGKRGGLVRDR